MFKPAISLNATWNCQRDMTATSEQLDTALGAQTELSAEIETASGLSLKGTLDYIGIGDEQSHDLRASVAIDLALPQ